MAEWDTYINGDFKDMPAEEERVAIIRDLTPGKYKYRSTHAKGKKYQKTQKNIRTSSGYAWAGVNLSLPPVP